MCKMYNKTPAEYLYVDDEYTAFCLNEACAYIRQRIEDKEIPQFVKVYKSFSDIYKKYEKGGDASVS